MTRSMKRRSPACPLRLFVVTFFGLVLALQWILNLQVYSSSSQIFGRISPTATASNDPKERDVYPQALTDDTSHVLVSPTLVQYSSEKSPVFTPQDLLYKKFPLRVGLVTIFPLIGEAKHFLWDGVVGSNFLELTHTVYLYGINNQSSAQTTPSPDSVDIWLVDGARVAKLKRPFLDALLRPPPEKQRVATKVLFLDFSDRFQFQLNKYRKLRIWRDLGMSHHIRLAVRSIVQGRHFVGSNDNASSIMAMGHVAPNWSTGGGPMLHSPYAVRTDIVETLYNVTQTMTTVTVGALESAIFDGAYEYDQHRPVDVLHLWQISFKEGKSKYRNAVSKLVRGWNGTYVTSIEEAGARHLEGRNRVDPAYVRSLLSAKIVIVTQKDDWEDHYRLMEALVCGPLVLADAMLAPPFGLESHRSIIFFSGLEELEALVSRFLSSSRSRDRQRIARNGFRVAMERHRSWHRIEVLLFGRIMTRTTSL